MNINYIYSDYLASKVFWQYCFYFSLCDILVFFIFYYCPLLPIIAHFGRAGQYCQPWHVLPCKNNLYYYNLVLISEYSNDNKEKYIVEEKNQMW